ncbi:hypothetical protein L596_030234 [Steinernema carpocapsae]|uniref:Uncharacterized protein n=1 Tax=Steinernema carpocapsae TaxID=34508 RepID=A0A4U5LS51_STECR|nr:hypothetical protein L596_030234 [Steinernema carpocapsae]
MGTGRNETKVCKNSTVPQNNEYNLFCDRATTYLLKHEMLVLTPKDDDMPSFCPFFGMEIMSFPRNQLFENGTNNWSFKCAWFESWSGNFASNELYHAPVGFNVVHL